MMEPSLLDVLTWREWIQLAGLSTVILLSLYVIGQFLKIMRRD